jgi:hypothetical protein
MDNRYHALRNLTLPGTEQVIPLILVGPPGVIVMVISSAEGVFRAKEDTWLEMNRGTRQYRPAAKNLIQETAQIIAAVEKYIKEQGFPSAPIQSALVFSQAGIHIESSRPAVRIVRIDGLERFATSLAQGDAVLSAMQIQNLVDLLTKKPPEESPQIEPLSERKPVSPGLDNILRKLQFSKRQAILLVVMVVFEVLLLILLIFIILLSA